jgi:CRP-like cAMP-binding protein
MPISATQILRPGERTSSEGKPIANRILLSIPDNEFRILRPHLQFVHMPHHMTLHEPHGVVKALHFPNTGLISLVVELKNGRSVEAGLLGSEGAGGIPSVLGLERSPLKEIVQIEGQGFKVRTAALRSITAVTPQFNFILNQFAAGLLMQVAQTAACNRLHKIEERLARWLLTAQDRVDQGTIRLTQDFLATMLGTDRSSVTFAAGVLQKSGAIQHNRALVKILNRKRLEALACECYSVVKQYGIMPR